MRKNCCYGSSSGIIEEFTKDRIVILDLGTTEQIKNVTFKRINASGGITDCDYKFRRTSGGYQMIKK